MQPDKPLGFSLEDMGAEHMFETAETTRGDDDISFMDQLRYAVELEAGFFKKNWLKSGPREAFRVLIYNTRWRVGYWIGPFHHDCGDPDCSACLD